MARLNFLRSFQIGDGAVGFEHAAGGADARTQFLDAVLQQLIRLVVDGAFDYFPAFVLAF